MNKILLLLTIFVGFSMTLLAQETVNGFETSAMVDTVFWNLEISDNADPDSGYANTSLTAEAAVGDSAMRIEYGVHRTEGYGGFTKIEHFHPDSNSVYDWSAYDSISFMYYVETPQSLPTTVELRFCLYDVSENGPTTYDVNNSEYYYSFHKILDATPGWNKIKMPLDWNDAWWNGEGFKLTDWTGIWGNTTLDKDMIKGYAIEFSIGGSADNAISEGVVLIDEIAIENPGKVETIYFNGRDFPGNVTDNGVWGNSSYSIEEGAGYTPETNAVKWTVGGDWQGMYLGTANPVNMSFVWPTDSLKFKIKVPAGTGPFRVWLEDNNETVGKSFYSFDPETWNWDGEWKIVELSLNKDLVVPDPVPVDSSKVKRFVLMTEAGFGETADIYFDDIWIGNPIIDIFPPEKVTNLQVLTGEFFNTISWTDVEGEEGEKYKVYSSLSPITDVAAAGVDLVGTVVESESAGNDGIREYLYSPVTSQNLSLYYAVVCIDSWGNEGEAEVTANHVRNDGRAIPTIPVTGVENFVADGDLSEWTAAGITPFALNPEDAFVTTGVVTNKEDLDGLIYVAMDSNYIYIAADVIDDVFYYNPGNWWEQDAFEFFVGLYPFTGVKHAVFAQRGIEPDYKFVITQDNVNVDVSGGGIAHEDTSAADFYFEEFGGADYVFETRLHLDSIKVDGDTRFYPTADDRITLTLTIHDNDGAGFEGNVGLSPYDKDTAYQTGEAWIHTWLGDGGAFTDVSDDFATVPQSYALRNNYPNPFNPSTTIAYLVPKASDVKVEIFNVLGQKVMTLVDGKQLAGEHKVTFNAKDLASGIYFYRLKAGSFNQTKKMILMK